MGTPAYMAPEQARGEAKFVGPAADVWALGAILYECLTGKRAFDADDTWAVLRKVTDDAPLAPRAHDPGLPRDLELIALKCLEKTPADRYPSAAALAADLESYRAGRPVSVRPAGPLERALKWTRRNRGAAGAVAAVALALVVGSAVSLAFGLVAWKRGEDLERANSGLSRTNDELGQVNADLVASRNQQTALAGGLKDARDDLAARARDLTAANDAAGERGYLSDVALAHQLWRANDFAGMRGTLARCPPGRRRWEWHHLDGLSRPERAAHHLDSPPLALAYSPDGKTLAFVTLAGALGAFDTATGRPRLETQLDANGGRNRAVAFRPDGHEMAVVSGDRLYLVDTTAAAWKEAEFAPKNADGRAARHPYLALGYAADGRLLGAAASNDVKARKATVTIRDVRTDAAVAALAAWETPGGVVAEPAGAAFSPDGTRFAASAVDTGIRVGDDKDGPVKFDPFQPVVMVWDIPSGKLLNSTEAGSSLFGSVAFAPDGKSVAFGRRGVTAELDPGPKGGLVLRPGHTSEVVAVAFDRNALIWSGGEDRIVLGLDRASGDQRFVLRGCPQGVLRLAVSPDGREVAAAAGDLAGGGVVMRFDVARLARDVWRSPAARDRMSSVVALTPDGSRFAALDLALGGGPDTRFVVRDVAGGPDRAAPAPGMPLVAAFRAGGGLVMLDRGKQLLPLDPAGKPGKQIPLPEDFGRFTAPVLACTPDGKTVAAVAGVEVTDRPKDGPRPVRARLLTFDADTGKPGVVGEADLTAAVPPGVPSASMLPTAAAADRDGKRVAATFLLAGQAADRNRLEMRGALVVWDLATGKEVFRQVRDERFHAVGFDPHGRVVVGGGTAAGGVVFGWDPATGKNVLTLSGHTRPVLALAFGPDGRLATGGLDRVVKVWDAASGREVLTLDGFAREVTHVAFTPDGKNLVAASGVDLVTTMLVGGLPVEWPPAEVRVFRGPR
jgi:WD40 repeat protein